MDLNEVPEAQKCRRSIERHEKGRNQTIMNMARCVLIKAKLPYNYWIFGPIRRLNRLSARRFELGTPYELWMGVKPDVKHLRPFGCAAYAHIESSMRNLLQSTSIKFKFLEHPHRVGFKRSFKAYLKSAFKLSLE
jgi:hypothetical protein